MKNKLFLYIVKTVQGQTLGKKVYARSVQDINKILYNVDESIIGIFNISWLTDIGISTKQLSATQTLSLFGDLYKLCKSGVDLLDSLQSIEQSGYLEYSLSYAIYMIQNGQSLSVALKDSSIVTNDLILSFIKNAEKHGDYTKEFHNIMTHLQWWMSFKTSLTKALVYPFTLLVLNFAIVYLLIDMVLPSLCNLYTSIDKNIPEATQFLLVFPEYFSTFARLLFALVILVISSILVINKYPIVFNKYINKILKIMVSIPWLGNRLKEIVLLQYFENLYALSLANRKAIIDNMYIAEHNIYPILSRHWLSNARSKVERGYTVSQAFNALNILPIIVLNMLRVAENSGDILINLKNIVEYLEESLQTKLSIFARNAGTFVMLLVGLVLLLIVCSVFLPLYDGLFEL